MACYPDDKFDRMWQPFKDQNPVVGSHPNIISSEFWINDHTFFISLNATAKGVTVYSAQWPLSGQPKLTLAPASGEPVGSVINAGEVFQILHFAGRTGTRDGNLI
ncbi:unnamed protein product [Lupinus luteus]|uniref:Uncharacterized protein n=1 Tax=Lupinus luteus TaxID=3873 RepID=A0AAV1WVV6_LUPLU